MKSLFNLPNLVSFRRKLHSFPESGFKEFETHKAIYKYLTGDLQVPADQIRVCAGTGLIVDLCGRLAG